MVIKPKKGEFVFADISELIIVREGFNLGFELGFAVFFFKLKFGDIASLISKSDDIV